MNTIVSGVAAMLVVLLVGDFASTFFYHVPQHVWGKLHLRTHHDRRRSYWDHAVLSRDPAVLLDGILGAVPYVIVAVLCARLSIVGAVLGLVLGQLHVWWRHTTELGWRSPAWLVRLARLAQVVLPEDHDGHHRNPEIEFGDIFRCYDVPARAMIATLRAWTPRRTRVSPVARSVALKRRPAPKPTS
ncbi:MAG: fatty acid hydroxylase [Vulcanimicrobiaceae bacterium]